MRTRLLVVLSLHLVLPSSANAREPGRFKLAVKTRLDAVKSALTGKPRVYAPGAQVQTEWSEPAGLGDTRTVTTQYRVGKRGGLRLDSRLERVRDDEHQTKRIVSDIVAKGTHQEITMHPDGGRTYETAEPGVRISKRRYDAGGGLKSVSRLDLRTWLRESRLFHSDGSKTYVRSRVNRDAEGIESEERLLWRTTR